MATDEKFYLFAFDFDGTLADTFTPSPNNIGVNEACSMAVTDLFGTEGHDAYVNIGGLSNRAPVELIGALLEQGEKTGTKDRMLLNAKAFASGHLAELKSFVPEGKGASLDSLVRDGVPETSALAEAFVRAKLAHLMPEIGSEWPRPMPGVLEALAALRALAKGSVRPHIAVLSSGHETFIRKCFEVWGVPQPDIFVTDDDLRAVPYLSSEAKVKPSIHLLAKLHQQWRRKRGLAADQFDAKLEQRLLREGAFYAGDDETRDGALALQSDVFFGYYNPAGKHRKTGDNPHLVEFSHWNELTDFLTTPGIDGELEVGKAIGELWKEVRGGGGMSEFSRRPV